MQFGVSVQGARWDEDEQHWVVTTTPGGRASERQRAYEHDRDHGVLTTRYLLTATGFLSQPRLPDIAGVHDFAGEVIHTASVGRRRRSAGQAGRRDRHGGDRRTAGAGDRGPGRRADRLPAHPDLGHPEDRLRDPEDPAAAVRPATVDPAARAGRQQHLARGDDGLRGAALPPGRAPQPGCGSALAAPPAQAGRRPGAAPEADAGLLASGASGRRSPTTTSPPSPDPTCTSRPRRSSGSRPAGSSRPTARPPRSTPSSWPPGSTCGTRTSPPSR